MYVCMYVCISWAVPEAAGEQKQLTTAKLLLWLLVVVVVVVAAAAAAAAVSVLCYLATDRQRQPQQRRICSKPR